MHTLFLFASALLMFSGCRTSPEDPNLANLAATQSAPVGVVKMATPPPAMTPLPGHAPSLCESWAEPLQFGLLETSYVDEGSGLEAYGGELIHINDSGDGPYVYVSGRDGKRTRKLAIENGKPRDVEDLSIGNCGMKEPCLYIGDIGDNKEARKDILITVLPISKVMAKDAADPTASKPIVPLRRLRLRYPDRAHNAEAFAITPNGALVIVTKEMDKDHAAQAAHVFFLPPDKVLRTTTTTQVLQAAGTIDVPKIVSGKSFDGLVTSMDITNAGDRVVLLTYQRAIEFNWRFDDDSLRFTRPDKNKVDFRVIELKRLNQQEGICYDENQQDLLYDTEAWGLPGALAANAELMLVRCQKPSAVKAEDRKQ